MSLAQLLAPPDRSVILVVGPPGAGKSAFCHRVVLNALTLDEISCRAIHTRALARSKTRKRFGSHSSRMGS